MTSMRLIPEKEIGVGRQSVYVYFAETERRLAGLEGRDTWPCKVGFTGTDLTTRIFDQRVATGMALPPVVGLVIRDDDAAPLERKIHKALRLRGAKINDAIGDEWYHTSPRQISDLIKGGIDAALMPPEPGLALSAQPTVSEIITVAGGPREIAAASAPSIKPIAASSVYCWPRSGIPEWHWATVIGLTGATPEQIYAANCAARGVSP